VTSLADYIETAAARASRYTTLVLSELRRRGVILAELAESITFRCPHCGDRRGVFDLSTTTWHCLDCPANGVAESLAITLECDPEIPPPPAEDAIREIVVHLFAHRITPHLVLTIARTLGAERGQDHSEAEAIAEEAAARELERRRMAK
jgi:hypothetical protein